MYQACTFCYKLKRKKHEPLARWCTRYGNKYTKVRRALARLQRTESTEDTELQQPCVSPQGGQAWYWSERNSGGVAEWDRRSDAGSNAWSRWNWSSGKVKRGSTWNGTQAMRIEDCDEAPPLFPEPVLARFFLQESGLEARERERKT